MRRILPRYSRENFPAILELADTIASISDKFTPNQIGLAFMMAQGPDVIPLPGSKQIKYNDENLGAADVYLTEADVVTITAACRKAAGNIQGDAKPDWGMVIDWVETPLPTKN